MPFAMATRAGTWVPAKPINLEDRMKLTLLTIATALFLAATPSLAAEEAVTADTQLNTHVGDDTEKLEAFLSQRSELADSGDWRHGYWHCTAFPNNDPHHTDAHNGYGYTYWQAYHQAMSSCQYYHHYCHAHCHVDHR